MSTTHYVDITVVPDEDSSGAFLLGTLYGKLHQALVQQRRDDIGVSFPGYNLLPRSLGHCLRLHGSAQALQQLLESHWLGGLRDHVRLSKVAEVPGDAVHRVLRRQQFKSNVERLRRRRMKRKGETEQQATAAIPDSAAERPSLPFVHLRSQSTGQKFCLFIAMGPTQAEPSTSSFNCYGLASDNRSTIPWF